MGEVSNKAVGGVPDSAHLYGLAADILELWLNTAFAGGRHQRRIDQITAAEKR